MRKMRMVSELILIFFVGGVWYCIVGGYVIFNNIRQEWRRK